MVALDSFYPMTGVTEQLAQWQKFAPCYYSDGVVQGTLTSFVVSQHAPAGMNVDVTTGQCFIQGVFGENGSTKTLTIAAADATNPRIDRVVLRCDTVAQDLEVLVITGTAAASPAAPALVRSATQTDYSLAQVLVGTTVTSIVTANITDERVFTSPRGIPLGRAVASSGTIQPFGPLPLTEGWQAVTVTGTTTISNIALGNLPVRAGQVLVLQFNTGGCQVNSAGNILLARPYISGTVNTYLCLYWNNSTWVELARSGEQAPAHQYYGNPTGTAAAATLASIVAADLPSYGTVTMGSLAQGVGVAFTQNTGRATQFGKFWHGYGKITTTGTGTAGSIVTFTMPAGITLNADPGTPVGSFRIDTASSYVGILNIAASATQVTFWIGLNPSSQWGVTPNTSLSNGAIIWFEIHAEIV